MSVELPEPIPSPRVQIGLSSLSIFVPSSSVETNASVSHLYVACAEVEHSIVGRHSLPILGYCGEPLLFEGDAIYMEFENIIMKRVVCRRLHSLHCQFVTADNEPIELPQNTHVALCIKVEAI